MNPVWPPLGIAGAMAPKISIDIREKKGQSILCTENPKDSFYPLDDCRLLLPWWTFRVSVEPNPKLFDLLAMKCLVTI